MCARPTRVLTSPCLRLALSTRGPRLAPNRCPMLVLRRRRCPGNEPSEPLGEAVTSSATIASSFSMIHRSRVSSRWSLATWSESGFWAWFGLGPGLGLKLGLQSRLGLGLYLYLPRRASARVRARVRARCCRTTPLWETVARPWLPQAPPPPARLSTLPVRAPSWVNLSGAASRRRTDCAQATAPHALMAKATSCNLAKKSVLK